ncbi:MAG: VOC family protein [Planctomycetota bacterium]|jgi:predicted enzyme related to lactoylglutathione lyase
MGAPVVHIEIAVTDIERSKHFYGEAFGWTFQDWRGGAVPYSIFNTGADGIGGALEQVAVSRPGGGVTIYLDVPDIEAALARAVAVGAIVTMTPVQIAPEIGWAAAVDDPDGNRVGLFQPVERHPEPGIAKRAKQAAARKKAQAMAKKKAKKAKKSAKPAKKKPTRKAPKRSKK